MAKANFFDIIKAAVNEVQKKNSANPNEPTADASVFDLLQGKLQDVENNWNTKRATKGKKPVNIVDLIKSKIDEARKQNKKDPNVETAPGSIFDQIIKKAQAKDTRRASNSIKSIIEEYNLDASKLNPQALKEIQHAFQTELKGLKDKYAKGIHDLTK